MRPGVHLMRRESRDVLVLGTCHLMGNASSDHLVDAVRSMIADGVAVYGEGISHDDAKASPEQTARMQAALATLCTAGLTYQFITNAKIGEGYVPTDVSAVALRRKLGKSPEGANDERDEIIERTEAVAAIAAKSPSVVRWAITRVPRLGSFVPTSRNAAVLDWRNKLLVDYIASQDGDGVAPWGTAHGPGIVAGLERHGFTRAGSWSYDALDRGEPRTFTADEIQLPSHRRMQVPLA